MNGHPSPRRLTDLLTRPISLEQFLPFLCCPNCHGDLLLSRPTDQRWSEILTCNGCGTPFPVIDGIPVLFPGNHPEKLDALFQRYWDSAEKAALYDAKVEGGEDPFGVYNHRSEIHAMAVYYAARPPRALLDAGCGNGRFLTTFPNETLKVGVDASLNLLRIARGKGRGDFHVCCELESLPFKNSLFDTVISCRVLQHLKEQERAVGELARITETDGRLILEIYNTWNLKTLYKEIRMSPIREVFNAPFRLLFRSMSPFADWGLHYDRYNSWWEIKRWMRRAGVGRIEGRGAGFGFHKYFFQPFYIDAVLLKQAPAFLRRYYDACFALEKRIGGWPVVRHTLEKFVLCGTIGPKPAWSTLGERISKTLRHAWTASPLVSARAANAWIRDHQPFATLPVHAATTHLREGVLWLCRAQDATPDDGVSRAFGAGWSQQFRGGGWQPSYPETTGYIIPTLYRTAGLVPEAEARSRAARMADWEIALQLPNGAVMGGTVEQKPSPAVFNTGQVIFGWLRAHAETGDGRYLEAATRAGAYLLRAQSPEGDWRQGNSRYAKAESTTYNSRVGWALIRLGIESGETRFRDAGIQNIRHVLGRQQENGWFADNCLSDPSAPLLHTICYAMEGIAGAAISLDEPGWLQRVEVAGRALVGCQSPLGRVPGRLDGQWRGVVNWDCLTGSAQLAGLWLVLAERRGDEEFRAAARRTLGFLKRVQRCDGVDGAMRGGMSGSYPFGGGYGRHELLNWATKFYLDALLLEMGAERAEGWARG
ncbi:MAG: methyltransferase domain-containing protein [Magnetococcales bacterium]|nr:methyltransferase domain-containing protein [Magnetococcales bacterium]